jgi:hypothetical protein
VELDLRQNLSSATFIFNLPQKNPNLALGLLSVNLPADQLRATVYRANYAT